MHSRPTLATMTNVCLLLHMFSVFQLLPERSFMGSQKHGGGEMGGLQTCHSLMTHCSWSCPQVTHTVDHDHLVMSSGVS